MPLYSIIPSAEPIAPTLGTDLALHIRYAPLTTIAIQIGTQQQTYLSTPTCAGCKHRRCTPDCRVQLLRRMLRANGVARDLRPVPHGIQARAYTRLTLAVPGKQAHILDGSLLRPWRDARLWTTWRTVAGRRMVGLALAVGADGPEPASILRELGWRTIAMPRQVLPHFTTPIPPILPFGWHSLPHPFLFLPQPTPVASVVARIDDAHESCVEPPEPTDDALLQQASQKLAAIINGSTSAPHPIPNQAAPIANLPAILELICSHEIAQNGLGIDRVRRLTNLARGEAALLLCWLDLASVVVQPPNPQQPWREPRPLITTNAAEILDHLTQTPLPTHDHIAMHFPKAARSPLSHGERGRG
jgi:hypothetical protein